MVLIGTVIELVLIVSQATANSPKMNIYGMNRALRRQKSLIIALISASNKRLTVIVAHKAVDRSGCQPSAELTISSTDGPAMATLSKSQKLELGADNFCCAPTAAENNPTRALRFNNKASDIRRLHRGFFMALFGSFDVQKIALVGVLGKS